MPFRRKHRNPLFGSSRSANKENASEGIQEPLLQQPVSPRLFRCHSDNSQRTCGDINPNTISTSNHVCHPHRNSVLSTKEKMSNLLQLNSTLVKEVSSLRTSQQSVTAHVESLKEQLHTTSFAANALKRENLELVEEINQLETAHLETKETLEEEKKEVEDRLECVSLVVDNLQTMNAKLAEEAARLREDVDRYAAEKHILLADMEKVLGEKSLLEELVDSIRASEEAFRMEMQQALAQAEKEKKALFEEKQALIAEKDVLQSSNEELSKEVGKLESERMALMSQREGLMMDKEKLHEDLGTINASHEDAVKQLASEKHALAAARATFSAYEEKMFAEKKELECSLLHLREEHKKAIELVEAERQTFKCEAEQIKQQSLKLADERNELQHCITGHQENIQNILSQRKMLGEELKRLKEELLLSKDAAMEAQAQSQANFETTVKEKDDAIMKLHREMQDARKKVLALEGQCKKLSELISASENQLKAKSDEIATYKEKLDEATHVISSLENRLIAEGERQKRLEAHIQTMKGDLLIAEEAAIQAKNKAKVAEKDAGIAVEKRSREALQKIGALESKLATMAERNIDLENHVRFKENACKAAVQAEKEMKAKLKEVLDGLQVKARSIEGNFEALKASMLEMQNSAIKGSQSIACLQAEFASVMEVKVSVNIVKSKKKRGRSKARGAIYQAKPLCN